MEIIIDVVVILIILLSTILAYKKGLLKLAISLMSVIIAIIVSILLYIPVSSFIINNTKIDEAIESTLLNKATTVIQENTGDDIAGQIIESATTGNLEIQAEEISKSIVVYSTMIILFILVRILLIFVKVLGDLVAKIPVLKQINQTGGIIYGLVRGIVIIYSVLLVINLFTQIDPNNSVNTAINKTYITKAMYEYNVFDVLI